MKEQDAAHSFDMTLKTAEDYWYEYSHESIVEGLRTITEANFKQAIRICQQDTINTELTRLRSELQQKDEEIVRLKNDLDDAIDVKNGQGPTALSRLMSELQQERELRKELVQCIESITEGSAFFEKKVGPLIEKAKLK